MGAAPGGLDGVKHQVVTRLEQVLARCGDGGGRVVAPVVYLPEPAELPVTQDDRQGGLGVADGHGVAVLQGFDGHGRRMDPTQDDGDAQLAVGVGQLVGAFGLGGHGPDTDDLDITTGLVAACGALVVDFDLPVGRHDRGADGQIQRHEDGLARKGHVLNHARHGDGRERTDRVDEAYARRVSGLGVDQDRNSV